jgi:hypothetical protein
LYLQYAQHHADAGVDYHPQAFEPIQNESCFSPRTYKVMSHPSSEQRLQEVFSL